MNCAISSPICARRTWMIWGLPSALRWYAKDVQQRVPFEIRVEISGDERPLDSAVSTALFRVAQEALTNIFKYAQARTALDSLALYG